MDANGKTSARGIWQNEAGSVLSLEENDGALSGYYTTAIGVADHRKEYRIVGWQTGRCLGFTVSWSPESESITSWTALLEDGASQQLHTMWTLVRSRTLSKNNDEVFERDTKPWEAFSIQSSRFKRVSDAQPAIISDVSV